MLHMPYGQKFAVIMKGLYGYEKLGKVREIDLSLYNRITFNQVQYFGA